MNTDDIAEIIATTTTTLLLAALLVWLVVTLPLWSVPIVFALAAFLLGVVGTGGCYRCLLYCRDIRSG
jgi:hypothetical protein